VSLQEGTIAQSGIMPLLNVPVVTVTKKNHSLRKKNYATVQERHDKNHA